MKLRTKGGDSAAAADDVIALFEVEAKRHKRDHSNCIRRQLQQALREINNLGETFESESSKHVESGKLDAFLKETKLLEDKALELLMSRLYRHTYVNSHFNITCRNFAHGRLKESQAMCRHEELWKC